MIKSMRGTYLLYVIWAYFFIALISPVGRSFGGIRSYDVLFLAVFIFAVLTYRSAWVLYKPPSSRFCAAIIFYLTPILVLPVIGLILFQQGGVENLLGDYRWIQLLVLGWVCFSIYHQNEGSSLFDKHILVFVIMVCTFQIPFLISQFYYQVDGREPGFLLSYWYPRSAEETEYGTYGVHIGRYAGAMTTPSALALLGGVATLLGFFQMRFNSLVGAFLLMLGGLLVLATGSRTMIFGLSFICFLLFFSSVSRLGISPRSLVAWFVVLLAVIVVSPILLAYDVGRISSGGRIESVLAWFSGETSFSAISGRGGERWFAPLREAYENWTYVGTLINPGFVLTQYDAMDSYYVFSMAQAGPFIIVPFILVCGVLVIRCHTNIFTGKAALHFALAVGLGLLVASITGNTMTNFSSRVLLSLAAISYLINPMASYPQGQNQ